MKLPEGVTIYVGGKVYKGEAPDALVSQKPEAPKKKKVKKEDESERTD